MFGGVELGVEYFTLLAAFPFVFMWPPYCQMGELGPPSSVVKKTAATREKPWGGEIINDGHRQTRAHFYQEEVEERKKEEY